MLSLHIDNRPVELPPDFSVTMNLKSPVFGDVGSYSYPFKIPNSPRNAITFGFRHRVPNTTNPYLVQQGYFAWKNIILFQGTIKTRIANTDYLEGNIFEGNGDFNYLRKNKTLQDINFGQETFSWEEFRNVFINGCAGKVYPERNVAFPEILNRSYFETVPTDPHLLYFNYYENGAIYPPYFPNYQHVGVVVPMLYLRYVLKKIFEQLGYTLDDKFFTSDTDYNSLALYNSVDCNSGPSGYFSYSKILLMYNYHVPRMEINEFFSGLENMFNIRLFVNNNTRTVLIKSVDQIVKEIQYVEFSQNIISVSTEPEDKIKGFHLKMNMDTNDEYYTDAKTLQDELLKHIKPSVQTLAELNPWPASNFLDTRFVYEQDAFYILGYNGLWAPVASTYFTWNFFSEWIYKDDDRQVETSFSSLMSTVAPPYYGVTGNVMTEWQDVAPKLFFVQHITVGDNKVIARAYTDHNNLFCDGEFGLMNKHYKDYCDFRMSTKLVKVTKHMTFSELKDFDFSRKYMIHGIKYLVASIQVTIKRDRIMPAVMECYPV